MAKLQECELDLESGRVAAVTYPFAFERPEEEWTESADRGTVPRAVFDFYCAVRFFLHGPLGEDEVREGVREMPGTMVRRAFYPQRAGHEITTDLVARP